MDKIRSAIKDAEADDDFVLDFDNDDAPTSTPGQRKFMESIGHGLKPQKIGIPGTTVTLESIKQDAAESTDDVSIAMQQMAAFDELGIGGRFG